MRFFSILLIICCFQYACSEEEVVEEVIENCSKDWDEIEEDSVLTILAENSPASYFIYRGRNMGYEYELLYEFSKDMNIRLQIQMVNDLDQMLVLLNDCQGDIIACNLTITPERSEHMNFSIPHMFTHQILVQRKPLDYRKMKKQEIQDSLITEIEELKGKTIHVWKNSTYYTQIVKLNDNLKLNLNIIATEGDLITEELIRQVSEGEIDFTIADENVGKIDLRYYPNLDISLKLSSEEEIAFAFRKNSSVLMDTLNYWLNAKENQSTIGEVRRKYFERKNHSDKANEEFSSLLMGELSPYDEIIKRESDSIGWDWRLISAIIYQESKFETWKESWAGAYGLFQFMPATASSYGISRNSSAEAQIKAGVKKLNKNFNQWLKEIPDSTECMKFTLGTFNSGRAHIDDARLLCEKYDMDKNIWDDNVNVMLLNLSKPQYYQDEVVRNGYCRGIETYEYIIEVFQRWEEYISAFPDEDKSAGYFKHVFQMTQGKDSL